MGLCDARACEKTLPANRFLGLFCNRRQFKTQILFRILEADVSHHASDKLPVVREIAIFHLAPKKIAEHAAEIFMPRK